MKKKIKRLPTSNSKFIQIVMGVGLPQKTLKKIKLKTSASDC